MNFNRRDLLKATTGLLALQQAGFSQANVIYPNKPVRIVVPFNAGGATDATARIVAEHLGKDLGQSFIVENKTGASGMLGTDQVAKSRPDGYNLLFSLSTSLLTNQFIYSKLPYDPQRDLTMLSLIAYTPIVLVVHPSVPANNAPELFAWLRQNKGKVSYGSWGIGSLGHLACSYMSKKLDADMVHIAYKGDAPLVQELVGGQIQLSFASVATAKPFIENGRLKAIAVNGKQRIKHLQNVSTFLEQGIEDSAFSTLGFTGMAVPKGTPEDIQKTILESLEKLQSNQRVIDFVESTGFVPVFSNKQKFYEIYQADIPIWKELVRVSEVPAI